MLSLKDEATLKEIMNMMKDEREFIINFKLLSSAVQVDDVASCFKATTRMEEAKVHSTSESISLYDCLKGFNSEEVLDENNRWRCPHCKLEVQAGKTMSLHRLPRVLIIHLKRFRRSESANKKITVLVDYPIDKLDMSGCVMKMGKAGESEYRLFGVTNHYGGTGGGHYTAVCYNPVLEKWLQFDDSSVTPIAESKVVTSAGYVLFYQRVSSSTN